ncbi:MAG: hypothetical protein ACE5KM_08690 [Planctomycetaceae bacterium]
MFNVRSRKAVGRMVLTTLFGLAACVSGCGKKDAQSALADVSGTATVKGKPISKEGLTIIFESVDGTSNNIAIKKGGQFSGQAPVGAVSASLMVTGGVEDHGDTKSVRTTFGVDVGFVDGERAHRLTIPASGVTGLKLDFGPGEGTSNQ